MFLQILGAVGSLMSVASTVAAGDAAKQQADSKAREAEEDRRRNKLKFAQLHNDRIDKEWIDRHYLQMIS